MQLSVVTRDADHAIDDNDEHVCDHDDLLDDGAAFHRSDHDRADHDDTGDNSPTDHDSCPARSA